MTLRGAIAAAAALLAGCDGPLSSAPPTVSGPEPALEAALDDWAAAPGHASVSASVLFADGTQWSGASGTAGGDAPLREDDLIWIASLTKTMTGALILQLADEGRLSLDDPLSDFLPPRRNVDPSITLRQLLNHTNGLDNYTTHAALGRAADADPARVFTADELLSVLGPPHFVRGARTEYTNTAFVLLGQVAEAVTRRTVVELYHERLWGPLGLGEIFLAGQEPPAGPVARALSADGVVAPLEHVSLLSLGNSAWGLFSTARTQARWGRALFAGPVLSAGLQQEMRRLVPAAGNIPGESGAGLGIRSYGYLGRQQLGHSGGSPFGSSLLLYDLATGVTVVVLMNQGAGADHFLLAPRLLELATRR